VLDKGKGKNDIFKKSYANVPDKDGKKKKKKNQFQNASV